MVKVTASDGTDTVSDTFNIVVNANPNALTVANVIPNQTATAGHGFSYAFPENTFSDAGSDRLTYTATKGDGTPLPRWLTFTARSRTFAGTPGASDIRRPLTVKVTAVDGTDWVSAFFNIVVGPNNAPTVANKIPNQTAMPGIEFDYDFYDKYATGDTFSDADRYDTLTYTVTKGDGTALPNWLYLDSGTSWSRVIGTPGASDTGTLAVKVTASDGTDTVSDTFNIVVGPNTAPTVAYEIPNQTATAGSAFSYEIPSGTFSDADRAGRPLYFMTYTATKGDGTGAAELADLRLHQLLG